MGFGTMGWWYWFGMQIFGVTSIVLTWWLFLDAFRRKGAPIRFVWLIISLAGLLMQVPAFVVPTAAQTTSTGNVAAVAGVLGLIVVMLSAITHFYRSPAGGGSGWSLKTRDENSSSRSSSDRRRTRSPQASVPVGSDKVRAERIARVTGSSDPVASAPRPIAPDVAPQAAVRPDAERTPPAAPIGSAANPPVLKGVSAADGFQTAGVETTVVEDTFDATVVAKEPDATILDEPAPTLIEESVGESPVAATICDEGDGVVAREPDATLIDEQDELDARDLVEAPRLVVTDGQSSRVIVTARSGPFVVGRDPSKCSLAVDDARSSRAHFSITERDGDYYLQDMGSSNGTFVNGALVKDPQLLADGDTIEFGRTVATFEVAK